MQFFSCLIILANSCHLILSNFNHSHGDRVLHTSESPSSTPIFNHCLQNRTKRRIFWSRQLPGNVQTVTVTLTVTDTIFQLPPSSATADSSDLTPVLTSSLSGTNSVSATPTLPEFVTATDENFPTTSTPTPTSSASIPNFSTPVVSTTTGLNPQSSVSSTLAEPTPTPTPVSSDNSLALPTSTPSLRSSSITSSDLNPSSSNSTDSSQVGSSNPDSDSSARFLIPLIIVSIICALGLIISFLICQSRRLREKLLGPQTERKTDSIFVEDYRLHARMFEPNPTGGLNYQKSLSKKKTRKLPLIEPMPAEVPTEIKKGQREGTLDDNHELWLPQSSTGHGLPLTS